MNTDKDFKREIMDDILNMDINKLIRKYSFMNSYDEVKVFCALHKLMVEKNHIETYKTHWAGYCILAMVIHFKISLGHIDSYSVLSALSKQSHATLKYFKRDEVLDAGITPYYENRDLSYNPYKNL